MLTLNGSLLLKHTIVDNCAKHNTEVRVSLEHLCAKGVMFPNAANSAFQRPPKIKLYII